MKRIYFLVGGQVQGVGLRWSALDQANDSGLSGWIRNREEGNVEGEIEGPDVRVEEFMTALKAGFGRARIDSMKQELRPAQGNHLSFEIRH